MAKGRGGRSIAAEDRRRLLRALNQHHSQDFESLRTRALVLLAWGSALRISECVALDVGQVAELNGRGFKLRAASYIRVDQAKGTEDWSSAGQFPITPHAQTALRTYLAEARRRRWMKADELDAPLFITVRPGPRSKASNGRHARLAERSARESFARLQRRTSIPLRYRFHDLRHDAITRFSEACNGNIFRVAQFGRLQDVRTAFRYIHGGIDTIAHIADLAERDD